MLPEPRRGEMHQIWYAVRMALSRNAPAHYKDENEYIKASVKEQLQFIDFCTSMADRVGVTGDQPFYEEPTPTHVDPFPSHLPGMH